jgi:MFS family permease
VTSYRLLSLGAGSRDVGLVAAAFALLPLFAAIPLGRFADRRGGPLLAVGGALQVAGCLLLAAARTPLGLGGASAVLGLGHLALALGVQEVIARESHFERHDQHFGLLTAGVSLGQLVGPVLGGALLDHRGGVTLTTATSRALVVAAAIAGVATVCAFLAERSRPHGTREVGVENRSGSIRAILATPGVPAGIFASIAVLSAADVFTAYMPVLGEQRGIAPGVVGVLLALRAAASIASRVGIGRIVRFLGRARLIALSAATSAAAFVGLPLTGNVWAIAALIVVIGFGLGFGQPLSMTIVVQLVPSYARATALAIRLTGNRLGQVAGPAAAGVVAGSAGTKPVFWMLSGTLTASAVAIRRPSGAGLPAPAHERASRRPSSPQMTKAPVRRGSSASSKSGQ